MIRLDLASQHPLISTAALILLVYLTCLAVAVSVQLARGGRSAYWLATAGALLFLIGTIWGRGYLSGGATFAFAAGGVVAAVFGVALDLIFGPPFKSAATE
jgi:hypothetical protein